ncbi:MAG: hypothetical protein RIQ47_1909 [Bacteroidota bacterium]|jgi:phosphate:Na+ symporter
MISFDGWYFLAGLSLFVFSLLLLEESLKALAGRPFKKFLQHQTSYKSRALLGSAAVTGILQSSSVVLLFTLSFVGAGIMSMRNALAVVLGANLGTTFDSWIIAWLGFRFDISSISYPLLVLALVGLLFFSRSRVVNLWSRFFIGIALMFIGLSFMKLTLAGPQTVSLLKQFTGWSPYFFIGIGFVVTAIIQSSFAFMAIALSALHAHAISMEYAAAAVIGSELGTALKLIFGATGTSNDKKRVATGNIIFNFFTIILGTALLYPLLHVIQRFLFDDPLLVLVAFQSALNLLTILAFYPLLGRLAQFLERKISIAKQQVPIFSMDLLFAAKGVEQLERHLQFLFRQMILLNKRALGLQVLNGDQPDSFLKRVKNILLARASFTDDYGAIKQFHGEWLEAASDLLQEDLVPSEAERLGQLITAAGNILHAAKNIKDIRHNLKELNDSANDYLYSASLAIKQKEGTFYNSAIQWVGEREGGSSFLVDEKLAENDREQELAVRETMDALHRHTIKEYEAATLVNVYRELHSSQKAILKSMNVMRSI